MHGKEDKKHRKVNAIEIKGAGSLSERLSSRKTQSIKCGDRGAEESEIIPGTLNVLVRRP